MEFFNLFILILACDSIPYSSPTVSEQMQTKSMGHCITLIVFIIKSIIQIYVGFYGEGVADC